MRRVVVTGLGLVTPVGAEVELAWANIKAGKSGAARITRFDPSDQKCTIACEVKPADHRMNLVDARSRLGLFDCVDYPAMAARGQHDQTAPF